LILCVKKYIVSFFFFFVPFSLLLKIIWTTVSDWGFTNDDYRREHGSKIVRAAGYGAGRNISKYRTLESLQAAYYRAVNKDK
jgi:hypothetical protein